MLVGFMMSSSLIMRNGMLESESEGTCASAIGDFHSDCLNIRRPCHSTCVAFIIQYRSRIGYASPSDRISTTVNEVNNST